MPHYAQTDQSQYAHQPANRHLNAPAININGQPAEQSPRIQPVPDTRTHVLPQNNKAADEMEKARKRQVELNIQQELLVQMEQKKIRDLEKKHREKMEDLMEEERIRKEREEFERSQLDAANPKLEAKNLALSMDFEKMNRMKSHAKKTNHQMDNSILPNETDQSFKLSPILKKSQARPRTPIEDVEQQMRENDFSRSKIEVEQRIIKELPIEVERKVHLAIEDELKNLRHSFSSEQQALNHQLLDLRVTPTCSA